MKEKMTFCAVGDCFVTRRLPDRDKSFLKVRNIINMAQARIMNLETVIQDRINAPGAFSGGTWAYTSSGTIADMMDYGFNMANIANNHTLDYLYGGLEDTMYNLDKYSMPYAGAGRNLSEASRPVFLDCPGGRTALICATSSFHESWIAGNTRKDMPGRPGVNPLREVMTYYLNDEEIKFLKDIAEKTGINAYDDLIRKEGFLPELKDDTFLLGKYKFVKGDGPRAKSEPDENDMKRIIKSIERASYQADHVIVSIHSHQMGEDKDKPADFFDKAACRFIDSGACAVIGHGPHVLRGIRIYKGCPIFYSLGNFIFQSESIERLPSDFYEKYGLGPDDDVNDALSKRSGNGKKGLTVNSKVYRSIIPIWTMKNGKLTDIKLFPIELGFGLPGHRSGWPEISQDINILKELQGLSEVFSTKIDIVNGIGKIVLE